MNIHKIRKLIYYFRNQVSQNVQVIFSFLFAISSLTRISFTTERTLKFTKFDSMLAYQPDFKGIRTAEEFH